MAATNENTPSFSCIAPTDDLLNPIWFIRLSPIVIIIAMSLAETIFRSGFVHGLALGIGFGLLFGLALQGFQLIGITMRKDPTRSDVDDLHIAR